MLRNNYVAQKIGCAAYRYIEKPNPAWDTHSPTIDMDPWPKVYGIVFVCVFEKDYATYDPREVHSHWIVRGHPTYYYRQ